MTTTKKGEYRLIGVFGRRDLELAACRVMDAGWRTPLTPFVVWNLDETEQRGLMYLESGAWLEIQSARGQKPVIVQCKPQFWERIHQYAGVQGGRR